MKELSTIIEDTGIELEKAKSIWVQFEEYLNGVQAAAAKVENLEITDVSQKAEMKLARSTRLELKKLRVSADHKKKELKDSILKEGRFIDATYNLIAGATKPVEERLLEQENFAKRKEEERIKSLRDSRVSELGEYVDGAELMSLETMTDEAYSALLITSKRSHEERMERERIAEEERIAREQAEAEERAKRDAEQARIQREAEEREAALLAQVRAEQEAREQAEAEARREREARESAEHEAREAELRKAREEKERAERALREKQEAEERERLAEEERQRRIEQAGDKEKLTIYLGDVNEIPAPSVSSANARVILASVKDSIEDAIAELEKL